MSSTVGGHRLSVSIVHRTQRTAEVERSISLGDDARAPSTGRSFVTRVMADWGLEDVDAAVLLTSELVTNAVVHGRPPIELEVTMAGAAVRVAVRDGSPMLPTLAPASDEATGGRGLLLVDTLASRWGVEHAGPCKVVWFEFDVDHTSGPS